jgi:hypothetical protein
MSGPRDLRRGAKRYERAADRREIVHGRSHFAIDGLLICVLRDGEPVETTLCRSPGEVNRHRIMLSESGLLGHHQGAL